jgi:hypothetical protein
VRTAGCCCGCWRCPVSETVLLRLPSLLGVTDVDAAAAWFCFCCGCCCCMGLRGSIAPLTPACGVRGAEIVPKPFLLRLDPFFPPFGVATGGRVLPPSEWRGRRPVGQSCMLAAFCYSQLGGTWAAAGHCMRQ